MIRIETYNKIQLKELPDSDKFLSFDFLPITKHRALSHIQNPRAKDEDILLTLALEEEKLAGYLGTFPDEIITEENNIKFAWLSTLYVNENFRGKKIAQKLLDQAFLSYNNKIGITEFTKEAENLYRKTKKFNYINPKTGKRFYFRSNLDFFLPAKKSFFKKVKPILKIVDFCINTFNSILNKTSKNLNFKYEIVKNIDEESAKFIQSFEKNSTNRTSVELNWILSNPWILESLATENNYLFSSFSKEFQYYVVKIYHEEKFSDLVILQLRDGHLKIPYLFSKNSLDCFVEFLGNFVQQRNIKFLTSYQTELNKKILKKQKINFLYQKDFERRYFMSNDLIEFLPKNYTFDFQDGDGDCIFT